MVGPAKEVVFVKDSWDLRGREEDEGRGRLTGFGGYPGRMAMGSRIRKGLVR